MEYNKAIELIKKNNHLIGKKYAGAIIDEIIPVPSNPEMNELFRFKYKQTLDWQNSILPFTNLDVNLFAIFEKNRMSMGGLLVYIAIENLIDSFDVYLD